MTNKLRSIEEAYKLIKSRYDAAVDKGEAEKFDPLILPLVRHLNSLSGVATAFCCEGHFKSDVSTARGYVMMAATSVGADQLNNVMRRLTLGLPRLMALRVELAYKPAGLALSRSNDRYMAYILRFEFTSPEIQAAFYKSLPELLGFKPT